MSIGSWAARVVCARRVGAAADGVDACCGGLRWGRWDDGWELVHLHQHGRPATACASVQYSRKFLNCERVRAVRAVCAVCAARAVCVCVCAYTYVCVRVTTVGARVCARVVAAISIRLMTMSLSQPFTG